MFLFHRELLKFWSDMRDTQVTIWLKKYHLCIGRENAKHFSVVWFCSNQTALSALNVSTVSEKPKRSVRISWSVLYEIWGNSLEIKEIVNCQFWQNFLFNFFYQIFVDDRTLPTPRLVMHIRSFFIELPHPFSHTHCIFTIHFMALTFIVFKKRIVDCKLQ